MKRIIEHIRTEKLYVAEFDYYLILIEKGFFIGGCISFILYLMFYYVIDDKDLAYVFQALALAGGYVFVLTFFVKLCQDKSMYILFCYSLLYRCKITNAKPLVSVVSYIV